jgi:hypothetical protein
MKIIAISYDKPPVMENETRQKTVVHREVGLKIKYVQFFLSSEFKFQVWYPKKRRGCILKSVQKKISVRLNFNVHSLITPPANKYLYSLVVSPSPEI